MSTELDLKTQEWINQHISLEYDASTSYTVSVELDRMGGYLKLASGDQVDSTKKKCLGYVCNACGQKFKKEWKVFAHAIEHVNAEERQNKNSLLECTS